MFRLYLHDLTTACITERTEKEYTGRVQIFVIIAESHKFVIKKERQDGNIQEFKYLVLNTENKHTIARAPNKDWIENVLKRDRI